MTRVSIAVALVACGCFPDFEDRPWDVTAPRVLAVRGVPAEARPNAKVAYEALVAYPDGTASSTPSFAYCTRSRTVDERTGVTASCAAGDDLAPIEPTAAMLADACSRFGPNPPPADPGEPLRRPSDPDPTGGYFVPVRASVGDTAAFGFHRVTCDLAGATRDIFEEFRDRYVDNQHPTIAQLTVGGVDLLDDPAVIDAAVIDAGATATLTARAADGDAEPFVVYIAEESAVFDRRESLVAAWYTTAGDIAAPTQAVDREASTTWRAPDRPQRVHGWLVVTDSRGGAAWAAFAIDVR